MHFYDLQNKASRDMDRVGVLKLPPYANHVDTSLTTWEYPYNITLNRVWHLQIVQKLKFWWGGGERESIVMGQKAEIG